MIERKITRYLEIEKHHQKKNISNVCTFENQNCHSLKIFQNSTVFDVSTHFFAHMHVQVYVSELSCIVLIFRVGVFITVQPTKFPAIL